MNVRFTSAFNGVNEFLIDFGDTGLNVMRNEYLWG